MEGEASSRQAAMTAPSRLPHVGKDRPIFPSHLAILANEVTYMGELVRLASGLRCPCWGGGGTWDGGA